MYRDKGRRHQPSALDGAIAGDGIAVGAWHRTADRHARAEAAITAEESAEGLLRRFDADDGDERPVRDLPGRAISVLEGLAGRPREGPSRRILFPAPVRDNSSRRDRPFPAASRRAMPTSQT